MLNQLIVWLIRILHFLLVLYLILTPFLSSNTSFLKLHIFILMFIILHWQLNSNECALTMIECYLTGESKHKSFFGRLVSPVYTLQNSQIRMLTYLLLLYSIVHWYRLARPKSFSDCIPWRK
jgi:hypothetical protein